MVAARTRQRGRSPGPRAAVVVQPADPEGRRQSAQQDGDGGGERPRGHPQRRTDDGGQLQDQPRGHGVADRHAVHPRVAQFLEEGVHGRNRLALPLPPGITVHPPPRLLVGTGVAHHPLGFDRRRGGLGRRRGFGSRRVGLVWARVTTAGVMGRPRRAVLRVRRGRMRAGMVGRGGLAAFRQSQQGSEREDGNAAEKKRRNFHDDGFQKVRAGHLAQIPEFGASLY